MMRSITITGALGSGKSTVAHMLSEKLGYIYYSTGSAQRHIAEQMGLTIMELNELETRDPSIDEKVDSVFKKMNSDGKSYVVDSRLAWHFMPNSFKVKLVTDEHTAAVRIMNDPTRTGERHYETIEDARQAIVDRRKMEVSRFLSTYHVDIENNKSFDLILNTTFLTPERVCEEILKAYQLATTDEN